MKNILVIVFIFLFGILPLQANQGSFLPSQKGVVQSVQYVDIDNAVAQVKQEVEVLVLGKNNEKEIVHLDNVLTGNPYYDLKLKKGMKVVLHAELNEEEEVVYSIEDIQRSNVLFWLSLLFCGALIYVGRKKGLYSLVSIVLTCILIINLLSPMILAGINPILATVLICLLSTALTMYLVGGFNRKSSSATIGCVLSLIFAAILSLLTVKYASLNGFSSEHSMFLYSAHPQLNFIAISVSTMILATLGAVMDVAMSIASTINEIYTIDSSKTVKELFTSGMNVGRDIIGTMANTLILVYLGASLPLLLLAANIDLQKFINLNQVVTEIASALIGSIAIVLCVPITAIIAAELIKNLPNKPENITLND